MIDFFDRLYTSIQSKNKYLDKIRFYSVLRFFVRVSANLISPIYFSITSKNKSFSLSGSDRNKGRIIVSLTSFPARIGRLWLVIETILRQTKKPDKIILWLSKDQFPTLDSLPKRLLKQLNRGLEIELVEKDLRSHKKYYYTQKKYPNDNMVLIDDDIFYRSEMIEELYNFSIEFPSSVISQYSTQMTWIEGELTPYKSWKRAKEENKPNHELFFGSGGGTLFPPKSMYPDILDERLFMSLTPTADDIWLNAMCKLNQTKVLKTIYYSHNLPVLNCNDISLTAINNDLNQNDVQITNVRNFYLERNGVDPFKNPIEDIFKTTIPKIN